MLAAEPPRVHLLLAFLFIVVTSANLALAKTTQFTYNATGSLGSPWVGLVPYAPPEGPATAAAFPHSMENFYVSMATLMGGWSNFTFAAFEEKLDDIASRKNQGICRIYLDYPGRTRNKTDGVPAFLVPGLKFYAYGSKTCVDGETSAGCNLSPDWSNNTLRKAMATLISEMGKRYDGDKRIAFWQVGFLGQWGEWHDPGNAQGGAKWADKDVQTEILHAFNSSFLTTPLLVRYPDVTGNYTPDDIHIGFHDDSYAQDTIGNTSWHNTSWHFLTRLVKANATERWKHVPIGGELRPEFQKCIFAEDFADTCKVGGLRPQDFNACTNITHASWQWDNKLSTYNATNGDLARAKAATAAMGYRLFVPQVEVTTSTNSNDKSASLSVSVSVQNTGVAPCYYPAQLQLTYPCSAEKNCTKSFGPDLRTLLPSDKPVVATVSVPAPELPSLDRQESLSVGVSVETAYALKPVRFAVEEADSTGVLWASSA
eukprot:SAG31_NODE_331_length_17518_cov_32.495042_9_plen_485_part_00